MHKCGMTWTEFWVVIGGIVLFVLHKLGCWLEATCAAHERMNEGRWNRNGTHIIGVVHG